MSNVEGRKVTFGLKGDRRLGGSVSRHQDSFDGRRIEVPLIRVNRIQLEIHCKRFVDTLWIIAGHSDLLSWIPTPSFYLKKEKHILHCLDTDIHDEKPTHSLVPLSSRQTGTTWNNHWRSRHHRMELRSEEFYSLLMVKLR